LLAGRLIVLPAPAQTMPTQLNIVIVKGDGAVHDAEHHLSTPPTVRIEDENQKPIANAAVVFTLPTAGATGEFANHSKTVTVMTDSAGLAAATGLRTNLVPGKIPIHINASYRGLTADASVTQTNVVEERAGSGHRRKIVVILLIAAAAAAGGGAYAASRSSKTTSTSTVAAGGPTAIGITAGTGAVGAPH
jgi:hypothetical protein